MATEHAEEPVLAQEAGPTTTLALADEPPTTTTVPLETKRVALEFWKARRDLHDPQTKAFKLLDDKVECLRADYERELAAWKGKKLMEPQRRLESKRRRAVTMAKKKEATIARVVAAVEGVATIKDQTKLVAAVTAALEPPEPPPKKHKKGAKAAVEEEDDDDE